jgi:gluconolactonase
MVAPEDSTWLQAETAAFWHLFDADSSIQIYLQTTLPLFHEACVYIPESEELIVTSNRMQGSDTGEDYSVRVTTVGRQHEQGYSVGLVEMTDSAVLCMANGGVNYKDGLLLCAQGGMNHPSGLAYVPTAIPNQRAEWIVKSFGSRPFNSPNDVAVHRDGSIWFTDPIYGFAQGFRPPPQLPCQVYRWDPDTSSIRAVADGFGRPNGIAFNPDQTVVYITDTDQIQGDGTVDLTRAASM